MAVLSTHKLRSELGLGVVGVGTAAVLFLLWRARSGRDDEDETEEEAPCHAEFHEAEDCTPRIKSRVGNFKTSKLKRLVEGVADGLGQNDVEFDCGTASCVRAARAEEPVDLSVATDWEVQAGKEQQVFVEAARIVRELKSTATHRKLQHFYVVDRQLTQLEEHFREISEEVIEFPWRENRDDPMADLFKHPFMQLAAAADEAKQALLPVSRGFVKRTAAMPAANAAEAEAEEQRRSEDEALLGVEPGVDRRALESAFRHRARELHAGGHCVERDAFHALNNAYERCLARLVDSGWRNAYRGGGDILAHYLLIGTDPSESRYGEAVSGLLDALQRERLLVRIDVLRSWGEASGSLTGLGQG
eukprot:TRINITY_DN74806_c0_g1_i1.p1 TRINITY_DN74806_c0_g1~~TRINITY_DN74806_c0_g1_i1.p1  ORF type:complete len:422 (-),score=94.69 TRINITY_DN74806_c0_g1_i1:124-1206(-)